MECRIERGYLRHLWHDLFNGGDHLQGCGVVQRCEGRKLFDLPFHFRCDLHGRSIGAAMDNAVCDCLELFETRQRRT
jgi:hypothetical protein